MDKRIKLLGSYLDCLTMGETLDKITEIIEEKRCVQHVVINAGKINLMQKDKDLTRIVNSCPIINADGQSIVWAGRFLGYSIPERVAGIDIFDELVTICAMKGFKPYFFGASQEVVEKVVYYYLDKFPVLNIAGYRNGYFKDEESVEIAQEIKRSEADVLFVGFSSPMKEFWINEQMSVMNVPFAMGVGGSFDVMAGVTTRAPEWMQKCGLEWFYRFLQEPRRMFKRYFVGNFKFFVLVVKAKVRGNR